MTFLNRRLVRFLLVPWAIYLMFAQPGLPACWLEASPCEFHPHFSPSQAEAPHSHFFLLDQVLAQSSAGPQNPLPPAAVLLFQLILTGLLGWARPKSSRLLASSWLALPDLPPPKPSFAIPVIAGENPSVNSARGVLERFCLF